MKPANKEPGLEKALIKTFGIDRRLSIKADLCVPDPLGCGGDASDFRDDLSRREYSISGLCQKCQDSFFGK